MTSRFFVVVLHNVLMKSKIFTLHYETYNVANYKQIHMRSNLYTKLYVDNDNITLRNTLGTYIVSNACTTPI